MDSYRLTVATSGYISDMTATFDDLLAAQSTALRDATFVIVDLETTGSKPGPDGITEIGAVKVRGGEVVGEFQTFVNPGVPIPAFISVLTGITDDLVAHAPPIAVALPMFLEFAGFAGRRSSLPIFVAHNAGFDLSFLKAACLAQDVKWPSPLVVDTLTLARRILPSGEVRNHKLGTLAAHFATSDTPTHRALDDARATVGVLHGLIERVGNLGMTHVEDLGAIDMKRTAVRRSKRHLGESVPPRPGVYIFRDMARRPLYVGVSVNMRKRVMSYFTAAESRSKITAMVALADSVTAVECTTHLEARIRELRMISDLQPRFNRAARHPQRTAWVTLTNERYPRLSVVRRSHLADEDRTTIGPFRSGNDARAAIDALHESYQIRQCTSRLTVQHNRPACVLFDMGRCLAPCASGDVAEDYARIVDSLTEDLRRDASRVQEQLEERMTALSKTQRYEDAAVLRDRLTAVTGGIHRAAALRSLRLIPEVVAASPGDDGSWDIHVIRHGWLSASARSDSAKDVVSDAEAALATAASLPQVEPLVAETEALIAWLSRPGTRLVQMSQGYSWHLPRQTRTYCVEVAKRAVTSISDDSDAAAAPLSIDS